MFRFRRRLLCYVDSLRLSTPSSSHSLYPKHAMCVHKIYIKAHTQFSRIPCARFLPSLALYVLTENLVSISGQSFSMLHVPIEHTRHKFTFIICRYICERAQALNTYFDLNKPFQFRIEWTDSVCKMCIYTIYWCERHKVTGKELFFFLLFSKAYKFLLSCDFDRLFLHLNIIIRLDRHIRYWFLIENTGLKLLFRYEFHYLGIRFRLKIGIIWKANIFILNCKKKLI